MASVNENIAKAMDVLIRQRLGSLAMDQTIIAEITEVVNSAKGHYKIRYQNVIVDVYSENTDKIYKNGDTVYVKVPNGDFSAKKIIEGKASSNASLLESQIQNLKNYLIPVYPAIKINFNDVKEIGLIAGVSGSLKINSFTYDIQNFSILSNLYDIVQIEVKFRTAFSSKHQKGNYGIKIKCKISDNDNVEYILDTSNFRGNFYNYNSGAIQTIRLQIPKGTLKQIKSITFFEEMEQDGANADKANIFVENINVSFFDSIDFTEYEYYLYVNALQGYEFTENTSLLQFQPKCLHKGEEITGETGYQIYWYKKSAPMEGKTYAGSNWTLIETKDKTDNEYLDNNLLCVNKINNISNNEYKIIFKNDEDLFLEKEFTVYNTQNDLPKIIQKTNLQEKTTSLFLESNPNNYITIWESNGQKIAKDKDSEGKDIEQITIKNSDFTSKFLEIICYFYPQKARGEQICIGSMKYLLAPVEEDKDIDVAFEGIEFYQYDANGDIFLEDAMREKLLRVQVQAKEGYAAQIANTSFSIGDTIITNEANDPIDSMLQQVWIDDENNVHYKISSTYSLSKTNNTIKVTLTLINGKELSFSKSITFSKVGDLDTNNSAYTCMLIPQDLILDNNGDDRSYNVQLKIFYQGKQITSFDDTKISLKKIVLNGNVLTSSNEILKSLLAGDFNICNTDKIHSIANIKQYSKADGVNFTILYKEENDDIVSINVNGLMQFYKSINKTINDKNLPSVSDSSHPYFLLNEKDNPKNKEEVAEYWEFIENETELFGANYLSVTISINSEIITTYLTIPLVATAIEDSKRQKLQNYLNSLSLPQSIRYNSSGGSPSYYNKIQNDNEKTLQYSKSIFHPSDFKPEAIFNFNKTTSDEPKAYVGALIKIEYSNYIVYWPVIYYLNVYGNNTINNWNGEELKLNEGEASIIASQIIASKKSSDTNTFTGVAIGEVEGSGNGMYGYDNGINTFGLRSDGTAYFGKGDGIQIKGNEAKIYGNSFGEGKKMVLNLTGSGEDNAIEIGDTFYVNYNGDAYLSGEIQAMKGNIGGWSITKDGLEGKFNGRSGEKELIKLSQNEVYLPEITIQNNAYGIHGYISGQFGNSDSPILKMYADKSILIESGEYVRVTASKNLHLEGTQIYVKINGNDQQTLKEYIQSCIPPVSNGGESNAIN